MFDHFDIIAPFKIDNGISNIKRLNAAAAPSQFGLEHIKIMLARQCDHFNAVSYTHLTLPTN